MSSVCYRMRCRSHHAFFWVAALAAQQASSADWPQWRGPDRNGRSAETAWLDQWPKEGPTVAWRARVGLGFSSFVVAQGRAFTMGHEDGKDAIFCFEAATGREIWKHPYPAELGDKYFDGGTTGTPTVDGDLLFSLSRWGDAFCFKAADGQVVWSKQVQKETGARVPDWGFSGAPLVQGELVILNVGDAGLALDRKTGAVRWKSAPKNSGYSTPVPVANGVDTLVLLGSGQSYVAVDLSTGRERWRVRWLTEYGVNAADPIVEGDRLFLCTGYGKGAALFKLGGSEPKQLWKSKVLRTQLNGAVLYQGHLYGVDGDTTEAAKLKCLEFATGNEKWAQPAFGSGGLVIADQKIIGLSGTGELMVAPATPEGFTPTARAQVLGGKCWTAPVLADGRIYCRNSRGEVACLDVRKK
jgi:outer membrane protein assembly factor BamB